MSLRDLGVGKSSIDEMIQTEANIFAEYLDGCATRGEHVSDMRFKSQQITANVIHHIIFGERWVDREVLPHLYDVFTATCYRAPLW